MADYQLTASEYVVRAADGAIIPNDPSNRDWTDYQTWVDRGGVPDSYVPPEPVTAQPSSEQEILFDHENRLRAMEGEPALTMEDFAGKTSG